MSVKCAYHPDRLALSACTECKAPICRECETLIKGKPVCTNCVQAIRAKVAAEIGTGAPQAGVYPGAQTPPSVYPGAAYPSTPGAPGTVYTQPAIVREEPQSGRLLLGIVAGVIVGLIAGFVRAKFVYYTHIQFGLVDSFVGFAVGFAVVLGSRQIGMVPAIIGGVLAFCAMMFGWYVLLNDVLHSEEMRQEFMKRGMTIPAEVIAQIPWPSFDVFMDYVKQQDAMDWVFVAIGVYGGFITPLRAGRSRQA